MLKSIWLEGKRNQRVDHLIHTLVVEFLLDLKMRHKRQELGMHGRDLAKQRRQQILRHAPETPLTQIRKIDNLHFEVQSSNSNKSYNIDLVTTTCSCSDFPHIRLCKHIAAVVHFFGGADLGPQPLDNTGLASEPVAPCSPVQQDSSNDSAAVQTIINDIFSLSQGLVSKGPSDLRIANSLDLLNTIRSGLNKLVFPAGNGSHLPEKENIAPNQHSWPEIAT
jgi:SWIM zinc finger